MADLVRILVNGEPRLVPAGVTVAVALLQAGERRFRGSVGGEPRGPLCGMGICFECRVTVDGEPHTLSCQLPVREGIEVRT